LALHTKLRGGQSFKAGQFNDGTTRLTNPVSAIVKLAQSAFDALQRTLQLTGQRDITGLLENLSPHICHVIAVPHPILADGVRDRIQLRCEMLSLFQKLLM